MNAVTTAAAPAGEGLAARVAKLAQVIGAPHFAAADRVALKRYAPGQALPLAFYRTWLRHFGDELPGEAEIRSWGLIAWGLAYSGPRAHRRERALGAALAASGYSEARLERLLAAEPETQADLFASMVRFLASKGEAFDWVDAARLLLTRDPDRQEATHRRIAVAYYRQPSSHPED